MEDFVTVEESCAILGVSRSTVWRMIQRRELPSIRRQGRRLVAVRRTGTPWVQDLVDLPPFGPDHPMLRLIGAGRSDGKGPGSRDKYAILAETRGR